MRGVTVDLLPLLMVLVEQQTKVVKEARQRLAALAQVGVVQTKPLEETGSQTRAVEAEQQVAQMLLVLTQAEAVLRVVMLNA